MLAEEFSKISIAFIIRPVVRIETTLIEEKKNVSESTRRKELLFEHRLLPFLQKNQPHDMSRVIV